MSGFEKRANRKAINFLLLVIVFGLGVALGMTEAGWINFSPLTRPAKRSQNRICRDCRSDLFRRFYGDFEPLDIRKARELSVYRVRKLDDDRTTNTLDQKSLKAIEVGQDAWMLKHLRVRKGPVKMSAESGLDLAKVLSNSILYGISPGGLPEDNVIKACVFEADIVVHILDQYGSHYDLLFCFGCDKMQINDGVVHEKYEIDIDGLHNDLLTIFRAYFPDLDPPSRNPLGNWAK